MKKTIRKKFLMGAIVLFLIPVVAFFTIVFHKNTVSATENEVLPATYGLYNSSDLAQKLGGKKFSQVNMSDSVIPANHNEFGGKAGGGDGSGSSSKYFAEKSDTEYYYNQGSIAIKDEDGKDISPDRTTTSTYLTFGYPEVFYQGYNGGCLGGEFLLEESIDTADYNALSVDVTYYWQRTITAQDDTIGACYVYVYGKNADGAAVCLDKTYTFGVNYWSTCVIEFSEELVSVERIAVSIYHTSITNPSASGSYFYLANFRVLAKSNAAEEVSLMANDFDYRFYNGAAINGQFDKVANKGSESLASVKVFHANNAYAAMGKFISGSGKNGENEYMYGTQRIVVGQYVTFVFDTPVKASDYAYLDLEILMWPQIAEGSYKAETTDEYTLGIYAFNADGDSTPTDTFTLEKKEWRLCRINLAPLAENGYVSKFIIRYNANSANRSAEEDQYYSLQMGFHDGMLTNKSQEEYNGVKMVAERSKIEAVSVNLSKNFDVDFKVQLGYGLVNPVAKITYLGEEYEIGDYTMQDGLTVFTFQEVTAPYLTCAIKMTVSATNKTNGAFVAVAAELKDFTVQKYCENIIFSDPDDYAGMSAVSFAKLQTLAVETLNYGAAAQIYTNLFTDNLANGNISEMQNKAVSFSPENLENSNVFKAQGRDKVSLCGAYLGLGQKTSIRFTFQAKSEVKLEDLRFFVQEQDGAFEEVSLNEKGEIEIKGIDAYEFDKKYQVKIVMNDEIYSYCDFSINTYLARKYKNGENTELVKALYLYGLAASAYVGQ